MPENLGDSYQEELIRTAENLDRRLYAQAKNPGSPPPAFLESGLNLAGALFGLYLLRLAPAWIANRITSAFALYKSEWIRPDLSPESPGHLKASRELYRQRLGAASRRPAVLILTSHPKTVGEEAPQLGDLIDASLNAAATLSAWKKVKIMHAIDPFALDILAWPARAFYAGVLSQGHLAVNRQPRAFSAFQNFLFRENLYTRGFFAMSRRLKDGDAVCMALSGAVAHNARVFYTIREWAHRAYFSAKLTTTPKRRFEREIINRLTREGNCAALSGTLSAAERKNLIAFLRDSGMPKDAVSSEIVRLEEELKLETPYRERFFKALFSRLPAQGTPLLLMSLRHGSPRTIFVQAPVLVTGFDNGTKIVSFRNPGDSGESREEMSVFIRRFVKTAFHS